MYKTVKKYVADYETTVFDGQEFTEVWAAGLCEIGTENAIIVNSIQEFFKVVFLTFGDIEIYFHNLSFDGSFILNYLISDDKFKQALIPIGVNDKGDLEQFFVDYKDLENGQYRYNISDRGQWYNIVIKQKNRLIKIYDSFKLLPFSLANIGKAFKTKHQKLTMEYVGYRRAGGYITDSEKEYLQNDLFVLAEALQFFFNEGHTKKTIGSCCLAEFKKKMGGTFTFREAFPDLRLFELPEQLVIDKFHKTADGFIRKAYKGGWCYVVKGKEGKIYGKGLTADVNSLYPSVMHSMSGNRYPVGKPTFWLGDIPDYVINPDNHYYFYIRLQTEFELKEGYLPTIQIKGNPFYKATEWLETSRIYNPKTGEYENCYIDKDGKLKIATVDLVLSCTDYKLLCEHYELYNTKILGGCYFYSELGIFDKYLDHWREIKETSTGAIRSLAKLFSNNLYGKLSSNDDSSFKIAYLDNGVLKFHFQEAHDKDVVSIACGAAVTSYARDFTIRHAQANYYGKDKRGFIYADTDSIHCDLEPYELKNIDVHPTAYLHWKLESTWDKAVFVRQKTYIEHVIEENLEPIETPYNNITCAGMGKRCKELLNASIEGTQIEPKDDNEKHFLSKRRTYADFKKGLVIPSKLVAKNIRGGVLLMNTTYEMH